MCPIPESCCCTQAVLGRPLQYGWDMQISHIMGYDGIDWIIGCVDIVISQPSMPAWFVEEIARKETRKITMP
eukprot:6193014-Pleurochrysis_carterae.AAC.1